MLNNVLLVVAVVLLLIAVREQLRPLARWLRLLLPQITVRRRHAAAAPAVPAPFQPPPAGPAPTITRISVAGRLPGHLAVMTHAELLQVTGAKQLIEHLARHSRLAKPVFARDLLPAIQRYAEFVQLLPASESHHHANVGGLLAHTLETVHHALVLRGGYLLPRNGGAEIIDAQRDYWTYAIFIAALLHDVGKPLTDLRIEMRQPRASESTRWSPLGGSLNDCGAEQYAVKFAPKGERDYGAHGKLGVVLMQRLVPGAALSFLSRCPDVLQELGQFLGGEPQARDGVIAEIVGKADQMSTKGNLASGSRARFATARSVPLVEQLMSAIQEMLQQGGQLPLNRDGAVGWVYDDSIWFVAKRLADTVREYVVARAGDEAGIPGEKKNDRLFDCWQEYGQIVTNPATGQSIWHVVVHGEDGQGYSHGLSMLRFPLAKIWPNDASSYPAPMSGRIEVVSKRKTDEEGAVAKPPATAATNDGRTTVAGLPPAAAATAPKEPAVEAATAEPVTPPAEAGLPWPKFGDGAKRGGKLKQSRDVANPAGTDDVLPAEESARAAARERVRAAGAAHKAPPAGPAPGGRSAAPAEDSAPNPDRMPAASARSASAAATSSWSPEAAAEPASSPQIRRVALHSDVPVQKPVKGAREPSAAAVAFMQWVQQGLSEGTLKYNEAGAPVHFVEAGVALVSPALFREYATQYGEPPVAPGAAVKTGAERVGLSIQREVLRAGWHLPSPADGTNIWTFNVSRRGGSKTSKLSAVVLADARRWVMEPPPANPALQLPSAEASNPSSAPAG